MCEWVSVRLRERVCVCVYVCAYVRVCMRVRARVRACVCACMRACVRACRNTQTRTPSLHRKDMHARIRRYVDTHAHTRTHTHTHTHALVQRDSQSRTHLWGPRIQRLERVRNGNGREHHNHGCERKDEADHDPGKVDSADSIQRDKHALVVHPAPCTRAPARWVRRYERDRVSRTGCILTTNEITAYIDIRTCTGTLTHTHRCRMNQSPAGNSAASICRSCPSTVIHVRGCVCLCVCAGVCMCVCECMCQQPRL